MLILICKFHIEISLTHLLTLIGRPLYFFELFSPDPLLLDDFFPKCKLLGYMEYLAKFGRYQIIKLKQCLPQSRKELQYSLASEHLGKPNKLVNKCEQLAH